MRMLRLAVPAFVASAVLAPAASAATQQAAKDRFAQDAQGARIVSAPSTAAASTVTGTVSAKKLGVSSNATAGTVARAAVDRYAGLLGVSNAGAQLRYAQGTTDALGQRHVRFDQLVGDVPVYDGAVTVHIGQPTAGDERLRAATEEALAAGIAAAVPGATLRDVAVAIDAVARTHGYEHVLDHGGHGIGRHMHEDPFIANVPTEEAGWFTLRPGNTVALEPMLVTGAGRYKYKRDGWAVVTVDGSRAAHAEHTIVVTDAGGQPVTVL